MGDVSRTIGPMEMGKALIEALGLQGVPGVVALNIDCQAGKLPLLTVKRFITLEQAGAACALLKTWQLELVPSALPTEQQINADGSLGEARTPQSPSRHPREG